MCRGAIKHTSQLADADVMTDDDVVTDTSVAVSTIAVGWFVVAVAAHADPGLSESACVPRLRLAASRNCSPVHLRRNVQCTLYPRFLEDKSMRFY